MPKWWTRVFCHLGAAAARVEAGAKWRAHADEFLRPAVNDYYPPDEAAVCKSRALLDRALTQAQRQDLVARGHFYVQGKTFTYRIREGQAGNVDALDASGCVISRFCAHPRGRVPVYDVMLAQKLWIETDENRFLTKAAPYPLR